MSLLTIEDMDSYGGTDGHEEDTFQLAIDLSEFDIEHALNSFLVPTTVTEEEYMWPWSDGRIKLLKNKVTSLTTVAAKHSLDQDCVWQQDTECGVILDGENGLIFVRACNSSLSNCGCTGGRIPDRAVITYIAGFTTAELVSTTALGKAIRMAVQLRARDWIQSLEQTDFWAGQYVVKGFGSMDYNEQREVMVHKFSPLGPGPFSEAAWRIIKRIRPYPALMIRSSGRF